MSEMKRFLANALKDLKDVFSHPGTMARQSLLVLVQGSHTTYASFELVGLLHLPASTAG